MRKIYCAFVLLLVFSQGCRVGPRYDPPAASAPATWKGSQPKEIETPHFDYWWEVFHDDTLNALEQQAIHQNPNLFVALQSVFYARSYANFEAASLYPQLNFNPSFADYESLFQIYLPNTLSLPGVITPIPPYRVHQMQYGFPLNVNYEVDLWGKLRDQYDSALFTAEAEAQAYCTALLTLTTDLAAAYFQLRSLDFQIDVFHYNIITTPTTSAARLVRSIRTPRWNFRRAAWDGKSMASISWASRTSIRTAAL